MREAAVLGYVIAMCVGVATVIFGFCQLENGHSDRAAIGLFIGAATGIFLWTMSNWMAKENA